MDHNKRIYSSIPLFVNFHFAMRTKHDLHVTKLMQERRINVTQNTKEQAYIVQRVYEPNIIFEENHCNKSITRDVSTLVATCRMYNL